MTKQEIKPSQKMWRTLVRVHSVNIDGVCLIIPGWSTHVKVWCPSCAIPPAIFQNMKEGNRYHVGCNIGAEKREELCFDGWENEQITTINENALNLLGKKLHTAKKLSIPILLLSIP